MTYARPPGDPVLHDGETSARARLTLSAIGYCEPVLPRTTPAEARAKALNAAEEANANAKATHAALLFSVSELCDALAVANADLVASDARANALIAAFRDCPCEGMGAVAAAVLLVVGSVVGIGITLITIWASA